MRRHNNTCSRCGTRQSEWDEDRFAYVAMPHQCPGCELMDIEQEHIDADRKGVHVRLVPREVVEMKED